MADFELFDSYGTSISFSFGDGGYVLVTLEDTDVELQSSFSIEPDSVPHLIEWLAKTLPNPLKHDN